MAENLAELNRLAKTGNRGRTLVVGSRVYDNFDRRTLYTDVLGLDMLDGPGVDLVHDMENPLPDEVGKFDHIDLCSVMEHCKRPWLMARSVEKALNKNGTLLVSVPFVWRVHAYPSDYWRITVEAFDVLFPSLEWIEKGYLVNGEIRKLVRGLTTDEGTFMQRAEAVGLGRK
jgi:SAM-dependent methyltransferase